MESSAVFLIRYDVRCFLAFCGYDFIDLEHNLKLDVIGDLLGLHVLVIFVKQGL